MSWEFWLGYVVAGTKFFLFGMIWGRMRLKHEMHRRFGQFVGPDHASH